MDVSHITPADRARIRALDIAWMMAWAKAFDGRGFYDSYSGATGMPAPAEYGALSALHKLRVVVGNKKQARESTDWLRDHGQ